MKSISVFFNATSPRQKQWQQQQRKPQLLSLLIMIGLLCLMWSFMN